MHVFSSLHISHWDVKQGEHILFVESDINSPAFYFYFIIKDNIKKNKVIYMDILKHISLYYQLKTYH